MGTINTGRVILGGLVAGLLINISEIVLNVVVMGDEMAAWVKSMNLPPMGNSSMAIYTVLGFVLGIVMVWLYAAIRPRYGAGPKTAVCAGSAVWFFAYLYPTLGMAVMGMYPMRMMIIGLAWGLVEILIAAAAGGYLYRE